MLRNQIPYVIVLFLSCCGYTTRAIIPSNLKTIAIPVVGNATIKPGLGELLTEQLTTDFIKDRTLKITSMDKADLVLNCNITNYEKSPQSYTSSQEVSAWKITIGADIDTKKQTKTESDTISLAKGNVSTYITYESDKSEDEGINLSIQKLSQEIIKKVLTAW